MGIINTRLHGILDYLVGILLIIVPMVVFGTADSGGEVWVPVALGISTLIYSLFTDYEFGIFRKIKMSAHLTLDVLSGMVLMTSPWVFDFWEVSWMPYVLAGLFEIGAGSYTKVHSLSPKYQVTEI
ncbi:SPW repeat domain-containing protein [Chitinophaga silvisoli]|uniref:SPW repeat-containing integral membrane domain-containing protein n=1 Tax=Chitinophaga silvisoli TaxID=2291814 RepID=A0A3E1NWJ4_9BACT|nr:hypothetical protein [Chitinophaga silvisoli]RFM32292.1 hypothetical protein DXN04_26330 [Chitinophaga silvisoli]